MTVLVIVVWFYFLLRGIRWLWIGTIILSALILVADLASGNGTWHGDLVGLIGILLLLLPPTRRFFRDDPIVEPS